MRTCSGSFVRRLAALVCAALFLALAESTQAQMVDVLNHNGMSDIWELSYTNSLAGLPANSDPDGDGVPNVLESLAGTDPFDPNSAPQISVSSKAGTNFYVTVPSALGKQYQLQSAQPTSSGAWSNWVAEASIIARTGTVVTLTAPADVAAKFYRIAVSDVDTDGDGVNDWEEYQLGLDPLNPTSNGQLDGNGVPLGDYAYVTGRLSSQGVITIAATDPVANQPDPGVAAVNLGMLTVTRGGFPLNDLYVNVGPAAPGPGVAVETVDYSAFPRLLYFPAGISSQTVPVLPLANTNRLSPVVATLKVLAGAGYTVGSAGQAGIVIYPSATPAGTGLTGAYYTNSSSTYSNSANFNPANLKLTRVDPTVDFVWGTTSTPIPNNGYYSVRWTGQVLPQYSETYFFDANTDDGVRVWVNNQLLIDHWQGPSDTTGTIPLQAGVRYNIQMDYSQITGGAAAHLSWYSASQSKQIIPSNRLYPSANTPPAVVSSLTAFGFVGIPFAYTNSGANGTFFFTATNLPPGLTNGTTTGIIGGTPSQAGDYQVSLTASNSLGVGASVVDIQIFDTANAAVTREVWTGVPGTNIADIPLATPASLTNFIPTLEVTNYAQNYGERARGYVTVPTTGNYYFWLAASDSAELWISNDGDPVNKVRRAFVSAPGTAVHQWNAQPNQRSGWLTMLAGQRYYVEVLHKAGGGAGDNWSVGWLLDSFGTNTIPGALVPGYVLSKHFPLPPALAPGTLYSADLVTGGGVTNMGVGTATLRLSADNSRAILNFSFSGVPSSVIGEHIVNDPYLGSPNEILFDISATRSQPDGSYLWPITPVGTFSTTDLLNILKQGKAFLTILTSDYPDGELIGHFQRVNGVQAFVPPPPAPAWTDDHADPNAAVRFLNQTTFGANPADVATVQSNGYSGWLSNQFNLPASHHLTNLFAFASPDPTLPYPGNTVFNTWWQLSTTSPDQLRQRVAFALSEIMVVSDSGTLQDNGRALCSYYDTLLDNAFGNFRALLRAVTLTPAMGLYLDMRGNDVGSIITGLHANENYAREIEQLFSIGLNRLWPDGTLVLNANGNLVPTYDQNVIMGFASVFTGWNYYQTNQANGRLPTIFSPPSDYIDPMVLVPTHHELGTKLLLDNVVLPAAWGSNAVSTTTNFDFYCSQDLEMALDSLFNNQNVGPFICRQLIQRLVTSSPSPGYLYRVVQKFNDNGFGVRGDLQAVITAILLDYEARSTDLLSNPTFGKLREPLLRVTAAARAFLPPPPLSCTYTQGGTRTITITSPTPNRVTNETVWLDFTDTSGNPAPASQAYSITWLNLSNFTISASGLSTGTYGQTNGTITVSLSGHGLAVGNSAYLAFTSGGATNAPFQLLTVPDANHFTVATADTNKLFGNCILPKWTGGGYTQPKSNGTVTVGTPLPHGLSPGDNFFIIFTLTGPPSGLYSVSSVIDATHFTFTTASLPSSALTENGQTIYPLVNPPLIRNGAANLRLSTWAVNATDTGSSSSLAQTPLNSPTVFNFFFPSYEFQGPLAVAGLTTPEFQLTSDTTVAWQMNFLSGGLVNNTSNTNGLSSFINGGGAITLDLAPWMTTAYTSNAGIPGLIDALNSLLCAGQLSPSAKNFISSYATSLPYTTPTSTQIRDRVRAVAHLILVSPDFTIQK